MVKYPYNYRIRSPTYRTRKNVVLILKDHHKSQSKPKQIETVACAVCNVPLPLDRHTIITTSTKIGHAVESASLFPMCSSQYLGIVLSFSQRKQMEFNCTADDQHGCTYMQQTNKCMNKIETKLKWNISRNFLPISFLFTHFSGWNEKKGSRTFREFNQNDVLLKWLHDGIWLWIDIGRSAINDQIHSESKKEQRTIRVNGKRP